MSDFVRVASLSELPDAGKLTLEVDERLIVLIRFEGDVYCIDDVCTHDGGPLGDGDLIDCTIACPRHGARFDLKTGAALSMPATEPTAVHDVKLEGDDILVRLTEEE